MEYRQVGAGGDSLELDSLATTPDDDFDHATISDRGISPLNSPIQSPEPWQRGRTSISSMDALGGTFFDLSRSMVGMSSDINLGKTKKLTFFNGLGLVVGLQIGSGIFASPNQISDHAGSPGLALIVWVTAGLLAWTGAVSYAELGAAIPRNGGTQVYLSEIFGALPAFMYAWTAVTILKPGSAAIIALVCGEYFGKGLGIETVWVHKATAVGSVLFVAA